MDNCRTRGLLANSNQLLYHLSSCFLKLIYLGPVWTKFTINYVHQVGGGFFQFCDLSGRLGFTKLKLDRSPHDVLTTNYNKSQIITKGQAGTVPSEFVNQLSMDGFAVKATFKGGGGGLDQYAVKRSQSHNMMSFRIEIKCNPYLTPNLKLLAEGISIASCGLKHRAKRHRDWLFWELIGPNEIWPLFDPLFKVTYKRNLDSHMRTQKSSLSSKNTEVRGIGIFSELKEKNKKWPLFDPLFEVSCKRNLDGLIRSRKS